MTVDILTTGHIGSSNFYPLVHILWVESIDVSQTAVWPFGSIRAFIPVVMAVLFQVSVYLIVRLLTKNSRPALVGFGLASLPIYSSLLTFTPSDTFFLYVPFLLFLFYLGRSKPSIGTRAAFIIGLLTVPFSHPEVVVFWSLFLVSFEVAGRLGRRRVGMGRTSSHATAMTSLLTLATAFFLWFSSFSVFGASLRQLAESLFHETLQPPINYYQGLASKSGLGFWDVALLIFRVEGAHLLIVVMALGFLFYMLWHRRADPNILTFGMVLAASGLILAVTLFANVIVGYTRVMKYLVLEGTILIPLCIANMPRANLDERHQEGHSLASARSQTTVRAPSYAQTFALVIVLIASTVGVFTLFPSPLIRQANDQVTLTDMAGASWLVFHGSEPLQTYDILPLGRYTQAVLGYDYALEHNSRFAVALYQESRIPPDHLNFSSATASARGQQSFYLAVDSFTESYYTNLFASQGRITAEDFSALQNQAGMALVYDNGGFSVWTG